MKLDKTTHVILGITALAWSIPFVQAAGMAQPGLPEAQQNSAEFVKLDANRDGYLGFGEIAHMRDFHKPFAEADGNGDGRLDPTEAITAQQLYERALAASRVEGVKDVRDGLAIRK